MLTADDLGVIVADAGRRASCVVSEPYAGHLPIDRERARRSRVAVVIGVGEPTRRRARARVGRRSTIATEAPVAADEPDSPGFWLYTSGTTGTPKGAMHRHARPRGDGARPTRRTCSRIGPDDRCFSVAKLFFAYGLGNSLTFPFSVGAAAVLDPARPTPAGVAALRRAPSGRRCSSPRPGFCAAMLDADVDPRRVRVGAARRDRRRGAARPSSTAGSRRASATPCSTASARPRRCTSSCRTVAAPSGRARAARPSPATTLKLLDEHDAPRSTRADTPGYLHVQGRLDRDRLLATSRRHRRPRSAASGCAPATCTRAPTTATARSSAATTT